MQYLVLLYDDPAAGAEPGTPEWDADMAGFAAFDELAAEAVVGGEALADPTTVRTIRHDGGEVRVTDGPFAETAECLGGYYVLEAPTLDDAIELARQIPTARTGAIEVRPMVQHNQSEPGGPRYLATIHGPESDADQPGTAEWEKGAAEHGSFAADAGAAVAGGGAVQPTATATTIRVRSGEVLVTDGPFAEAIEVVGGYYVLRGDADTAAATAARIPVNPGGRVEIREILELE